MKYAISGIIVNAGILVNIAKPRNTPESIVRSVLFGFSPLIGLLCCLPWSLDIANNMDDKRKGRRIESNKILLNNHVLGITAKSNEATKPTFLLYFLSAIL